MRIRKGGAIFAVSIDAPKGMVTIELNDDEAAALDMMLEDHWPAVAFCQSATCDEEAHEVAISTKLIAAAPFVRARYE